MAIFPLHPPNADIESDFEPDETAAQFARRQYAATCRARGRLPYLAWAKARLGRRHSDEIPDDRRPR